MSSLVKTRERLSTEYEALESQFNLTLTLIQQVSVSLVVVHCAVSVINQDISQGVMAAVILLTNRYFAPYQQIMHTLSRWKVNGVYLKRLNELLELDEFKAKQTDTELALKNLEVPSFKQALLPGHLYVLGGPSCSGKTYLSQCIARERDECSESITTNGEPIQNIPYEVWREQVIHIDRSSSFVEGTIIDNITCFQPALHKAAYALCEAMQIKHSIDELRQGFYTELRSTNTVPLPRQVIYALAIIRAILSRKSIIIIDDLDLIYDTRFAKNLVTCIRPRSDAFICIFVSNRLHEIDPKLERIVLPQRSLENQAKYIEPEPDEDNGANKDAIA
jgi:ABC-type bacteriocin/lantibiotic exporter with double-glycine peptidase domain